MCQSTKRHFTMHAHVKTERHVPNARYCIERCLMLHVSEKQRPSARYCIERCLMLHVSEKQRSNDSTVLKGV